MNELENWAGNKYINLSSAIDTVIIVLEHHEDCKDEYIDEVLEAMYDLPTIKLRLMRTEECAGHTIEYAAGWKACIEWIKNGGDGGLFDSEDAISRPTGKWIKDEDGAYYTCSNCGCQWTFIDDSDGSPFCPECGADMRGEQ